MPRLLLSQSPFRFSFLPTIGSAVVLSCCSIALCLSPLNAQERPKSALWQINGIVAALENRDQNYNPEDIDESAFAEINRLKQLDLSNYRQDAKLIIDRAIAELSQSNVNSRRGAMAARALGQFATNDPEITRFLKDLANNTQKSADVRCSAVETLRDLGQADRQFSQLMIALIGNPQESHYVRDCSAESLKRFKQRDNQPIDRELVRVLQTVLYNPKTNDTLRARIAIALIQLGENDPNLTTILLKLLQDSDDSFSRSTTIRALGMLKNADSQIVNALVKLMKTETKHAWLRSDAVETLSTLVKADYPEVSRLLMEIVKNPKQYEWLHYNTIEALVKWSVTYQNAQELMLNILTNPQSESDLRRKIMYVIRDTTVFDTNPLLMGILSDFAQNPRVEPQDDFAMGKDAISKLGKLGENNIRVREMITAIAKERWTNVDRRERALTHLLRWAKTNPRDRQVLLDLLNDPKEDLGIRLFIAEEIGKFQPLTLNQLLIFVHGTHDSRTRSFSEGRFNAYFYGQGTEEIRLLMRWLGRPQALPNLVTMTNADRRRTLELFLTVWPDSKGFEQSRAELVKAIALIISSSQWTKNDIPLLEQHYHNLSRPQVFGVSEASIIKGVLESLR